MRGRSELPYPSRESASVPPAQCALLQHREVPLARHEVLRESALAGLPSAGDHDGRHNPQALRECSSYDSGKGRHGVGDNHSRGGWKDRARSRAGRSRRKRFPQEDLVRPLPGGAAGIIARRAGRNCGSPTLDCPVRGSRGQVAGYLEQGDCPAQIAVAELKWRACSPSVPQLRAHRLFWQASSARSSYAPSATV